MYIYIYTVYIYIYICVCVFFQRIYIYITTYISMLEHIYFIYNIYIYIYLVQSTDTCFADPQLISVAWYNLDMAYICF